MNNEKEILVVSLNFQVVEFNEHYCLLQYDKERLVVSLNFQVVEFNEHYCLLQYDKERLLKIYRFEDDYKMIQKYYEQHR